MTNYINSKKFQMSTRNYKINWRAAVSLFIRILVHGDDLSRRFDGFAVELAKAMKQRFAKQPRE